MLASNPASMVNQNPTDLGIPNRFNLTPSRSRYGNLPSSFTEISASKNSIVEYEETTVPRRRTISSIADFCILVGSIIAGSETSIQHRLLSISNPTRPLMISRGNPCRDYSHRTLSQNGMSSSKSDEVRPAADVTGVAAAPFSFVTARPQAPITSARGNGSVSVFHS